MPRVEAEVVASTTPVTVIPESQTVNVQVNRPEPVSTVAVSSVPSEQHVLNVPSFDNVVNKMVAENTDLGSTRGNALAPFGAIYAASHVDSAATAVTGIGIISGIMALRSIVSRAVFGRKAENAARHWVQANTERGWGPFKVLHRIASAPARFLSNLSYHPRVFEDLRPFSGKEGAKKIDTLSARRAMDLAAVGLAAGSIHKSVDILATDGLEETDKLSHLAPIAETGKAIFENFQAKIKSPEDKIFLTNAIKKQAQVVEDALYTTARAGYILGTDVLFGTAAWTWNAMGRGFGFIEKGWNEKVMPVVNDTWNKVVGFGKSVWSGAVDLYNQAGKSLQLILNPK